MTPNDFASWLQGFMDACGGTLTPDQAAKVAEKAKTVYVITYSPYAVPPDDRTVPLSPSIPTFTWPPVTCANVKVEQEFQSWN